MKSYDGANVIVQAWRDGENVKLVNYMPRKETCCDLDLADFTSDGETIEEVFERQARVLENLARLMRQFAKGEIDHVYYADAGMSDPQEGGR